VDEVTLEQVLARGRDRGFLGPGAVDVHIRHAEGFAELVGPAERFLDLGSGGGVPGLVLARCWPDASGVLLDAGERRCEFLEGATVSLRVEHRVSVVCGRAEDLARDPGLRGGFPLVVARGFGPPAVAAECGVGFLAPGGRLAVTEPPQGAGPLERRWPAAGLAELGLLGPDVRRAGEVGAVVLTATGRADERWPRRVGVPHKRPLW
jgi:16S rRNA (guanine527-N7)-methyltransferase